MLATDIILDFGDPQAPTSRKCPQHIDPATIIGCVLRIIKSPTKCVTNKRCRQTYFENIIIFEMLTEMNLISLALRTEIEAFLHNLYLLYHTVCMYAP